MTAARRPTRGFGLLGAGLAAVAVVALSLLTPLPLVVVWLVAAGVTTFALYGLDKARAVRGGARVPEVVLHGAALAGGVVGGWIGRAVFHHKTRKPEFTLVLASATVLWALLLVRWW